MSKITAKQLKEIATAMEIVPNREGPVFLGVIIAGKVYRFSDDPSSPAIEKLCEEINRQLVANAEADFIAKLPVERYAEHDDL